MTCEEALVLISGKIDGVNTPEENEKLQEHLDGCPACEALQREYWEIEQGIAALRAEVPENFCEKVMERIEAENKPAKRRLWPTVAMAAAAALVIGLGAGRLPMFGITESAAPQEPRAAAEGMLADKSFSQAVETEEAVEEMLVCDAEASLIVPQFLAEKRGAPVAVACEPMEELESCPREELSDGLLLYTLSDREGAAELSRIYGLEIYLPAEVTAEVSYVLLIS